MYMIVKHILLKTFLNKREIIFLAISNIVSHIAA